MSSEWPKVRLGDLLSIRHGWPFKSEFFQGDNEENSSFPIVVAIGNFEYTGGFRFQSTQVKRYSESFPPEFILKSGDILLVMTCQTAGGEILGIPAKIPDDGRVYLHNQRLGRVVFLDESISPDFAYWLFLTSSFNKHLVDSATGTKILHTAPSRIESFQFQLPPIGEQVVIAGVLNAIDDRITLLRETNATLEAIAQALFKSWFVDFDPVRAKMEGRAPEGLDEATAALFPDSFEDTELGAVPRGWRLLSLAEAMEINPTRKLKKGELAPYLDMASVGTQGHVADATVLREMGSGSKFVNGDTLLARITPCLENGKTAFVDFLPEGQTGWGSTEFVVLRPRTPLPDYFAYLLCRHGACREFAIQSMSGTSGRQRIQNDVLGRYLVTVPPAPIAEAFGQVVSALQQRIAANHASAQTLANLRDTLLPRLISGQLRLPEAQAELEAANAV